MSNNPFQKLQNEYDVTLQNIKNSEIAELQNPMNRSLENNYVHNVDNFFKVKQQVANLSNQMINNNEISPLSIPQLQEYCQNNKLYNVAYPNLQADLRPLRPLPPQPKSIFVNDMFTGSNERMGGGPMMNVLDMSNNYRSLAEGNDCDKARNMNRSLSAPKKCINSSFSNRLNQAQFRSGSEVVAMQADNGNVYHFDNGNKINAPLCATAASLNMHRDPSWVPQDLPVLNTINKEIYMNKLNAQQADCRQQQAMNRANFMNYQNAQASGPLNNPNNPVWKPLDSKYLN